MLHKVQYQSQAVTMVKTVKRFATKHSQSYKVIIIIQLRAKLESYILHMQLLSITQSA
jgi:ribosomal protein L31E